MLTEIAAAFFLFFLTAISGLLVWLTRASTSARPEYTPPTISPTVRDSEFATAFSAESLSFPDLSVVATFLTDDGFTETDLADLVMYLLSLGVHASYHTSCTGKLRGMSRCFYLTVPAHQSERARGLLLDHKQIRSTLQ